MYTWRYMYIVERCRIWSWWRWYRTRGRKCPASGRTGLIFAVVRWHHGQDTQVILCNFVSFSRDAGRAPFQISIAWQKEQLDIVTDGVCLWIVCLFPVPSVINIDAVVAAVHFLILLLFLVNSCYLNPPVPLMSPVLLSSLQRGGGAIKQHMVWSGFSRNTELENTILKPQQQNI